MQNFSALALKLREEIEDDVAYTVKMQNFKQLLMEQKIY